MDQAGLYAILLAFLPIFGKLLKMTPFVANKLIPYILTAFNFATKYWLILGLPTELPVEPEPGTTGMIMLGSFWSGGIGKVLAVGIWAIVENVMVDGWYKSRKRGAKLEGKKSWWE